jgi:hypothetical protein
MYIIIHTYVKIVCETPRRHFSQDFECFKKRNLVDRLLNFVPLRHTDGFAQRDKNVMLKIGRKVSKACSPILDRSVQIYKGHVDLRRIGPMFAFIVTAAVSICWIFFTSHVMQKNGAGICE